MKISTWNVNSLNVRLPHVLEWLSATDPDILVLQEIKQITAAFPDEELSEIGYQSIANGQKTYNGVAIISKTPITNPVTDFPGFPDPHKRLLAATINGVRVVNIYVPNGQYVGSEKFDYKLGWLAALRDFLGDQLSSHENLVVLGDFNVAPADADVHDPAKWGEDILCSPAERKSLSELIDLGLTDIYRDFTQPENSFSWWDYRAAGFRRNAGLRIDLILTSEAMTKNCSKCYIDKEPRAWQRPSDHTPVVAEFDL